MTTPHFPALTAADLPLAAAMNATSLDHARFPLAVASSANSIAFDRFLQRLNDSIVKGALANVDHVELKQHFGRVLGALWEKHVAAPFFYGQGGKGTMPTELDDFYYGDSTALHRVEANLRKMNACEAQHPALDAMRQVLTEFVPIAQRVTYLKDCIVKRQVKTQQEREAEQRFVPTRATPAATRHVWEVLTQVTARNERQLVEYLAGEHEKRVELFMKFGPQSRQKLLRHYENRAAVDAATMPRTAAGQDYVLRPDFKEALVALAKKEAIELRDSFIFKVVSKLAPIIERKGNLAGVREVGNTIQVGCLSGMLAVEFADGARFMVDNNVVYASSTRGKLFARFPLTFHDVILVDGSRMKQPSEERMHDIFCAAGTPAEADDEPGELADDAGASPRG